MRQKGFTLLELIIAMAIFAVVSALAYGGLNSILRATHQTRESSQAMQDLQLAMSIIQQDLTQITDRAVRDEYGEVQSAVKSPAVNGRLLGFTRRGWRNPAQRPRSTLQRVAYRLDENTLVREYWGHLDRAPNAEMIGLPLLDGVEEVGLRFMDGDGEWQAAWPPVAPTPEQTPTLPRAIEITLKTLRWGDLPRVFALLEKAT